MKRFHVAAAAAAVLALPLEVDAAEVTLRLSHWVPPTIAPSAAGIQPWAEAVEAGSDGRIDIAIFPAQQIGAAGDHYDMARDGIVDFAWVNPGYTAGRFPIFALTEVPFQVSDSVGGAQAIHEWYAQYADEEMAGVKLCFVHPHAPGAIHSKEPVKVPGDIAGLNVRPAHATMARFVSQLGGGPVQVPAPEAREAIARGTADAITFPWGALYDFGIREETKYHLDMPLYISTQVLLMNQGSYDALSDENKAVIDEFCSPEWSAKVAEGWAADDMAARERLSQDDSHTLHQPTPEEVQAWRDATVEVLAAWRADVEKAGGDPDAIYDAYVKALEANDARY